MAIMYNNNTAQQRQQAIGRLENFLTDDQTLKVLLVEDDYGDMLMTLQALNGANRPYELNRITHGDEVLPYLMNAMQERLPDLILLDMGLPGTNGFEILESLAGSPALLRSVPIAIITMYSNFEYLNKTYNLPIYGYLTKPVKPAEVSKIIAKISCFADPEEK